ncbi:phosphodiesterase [Bacillus sp. FJAT-18019]|nr:phosphodiesterase [Bacillus sp. FJAT-18019]
MIDHPYRITVLSDTHMPRKAKALPAALLAELKQSELILHAGDWSNWELYEQLSQYAPVDGVAGNVDDDRIVERLGYKKLLDIEGKRIGIVHGHVGQGQTTPIRARKAFTEAEVDCILFGHSHIPFIEWVEGVLLFNPGSATDKRRQPQYSYGRIYIQDDSLEAKHVFFDQK